MSIRQIFAHVFACENKVSDTTFSEFSEISRISTNFPERKNLPKKLETETSPKGLEFAPKLQDFASLIMYFSTQSDKYSMIYSPLKIKFLGQQLQNFQTKFDEISFEKLS